MRSRAIYSNDTTSYVKVNEIYNDTTGAFDANNVTALLKYITGNSSITYENASSTLNTLATNRTTSADIATKAVLDKVRGDDIVVRFGGLDWQVVYLSKDEDKNNILTLWLASSTRTSSWSDGWSSIGKDKYPSNMYGASYIRAVTLNNGGRYATSLTSLSSYTQNSNSLFARFTMNNVSGSLTQYLVTPSRVSWQLRQSAVREGADVYGYNHPNDSILEPENGNYYSTYDYHDKELYDAWQYDYLWLPSVTETGIYSTSDGMWETSIQQRQNISQDSHYTWTRSGSSIYNFNPVYASPYSAFALYQTGDDFALAVVDAGKYPRAVRPALHLNLNKVIEETEPNVFKIALNDNGGSGGDGEIFASSDGYYADEGMATRIEGVTVPSFTAHKFLGYFTEGGQQVADTNGVITMASSHFTEATTLYAHWEAKVFTVNLNMNGGSGGTSTIYLKYDSGWYSSSSCTSSSKITSLPSTPTRAGYEFKGYSTEPDGSGTLAVSATGAINVSDTFYSTDGTRTWYAVWEARNPAYYDSEGGFWYVENGKLPQSKVGESLKGTLEGQWSSLTDGSIYYMGVEELANSEFTSDGGMQSKVYDGEEYVKFNGEYYLVEPIRWRLVYSSSQQEGYAVGNTSVLATMAEIVFVGSYSSTKIGVGEGYSAESVTMLLKNQVSTEFLVNEDRSVDIFGTTTPKDTTTASGSVFVASMEELANFKTSKNNTTGSGVKAGKVSLSDFVKDYLRATGQGNYYFTRDLGDQLNNIHCLNPVGNRSQAKAQQTLGVQFTIKVTEYACKEM